MLDLDTRRAIFQLKTRGLGLRAIARALAISRNSVRTVLALGTAEVPAIERAQRSAVHLDTLRALYTECAGNRVRVWEEVQKQGLAISYPALTAFLRRQGVGVKVKQPAGQYHLGAALLEHVIFLGPYALERFSGQVRHGRGVHMVGAKA
jgi:hypothetical protein